MSFFKEFKEDLSQAVNELMPGEDELLDEQTEDADMVVNTLDDDVDIASELSKLDGLLEKVSENVGEEADKVLQEAVEEQNAKEETENQEELPMVEPVEETEENKKENEADSFNDSEDDALPELEFPDDLFAKEETVAMDEEIVPESGEDVTTGEVTEDEPVESDEALEESVTGEDIPEDKVEVALEEAEEEKPEETEMVIDTEPTEDSVWKDNEEENIMSKKTEDVLTEGENAEMETNTEEGMETEKEMETMVNSSEVTDETAVITLGTKIKGNISSTGSVDVQGEIEGDVSCNGKLTVTGKITGNSSTSEFFADSAKIEGEVVSTGTVKIGLGSVVIGNLKATSAVIAGAIKGDIDVQGPVVVDTSAVVVGNIKSRSVQINNGAVIEGFCSQCYAEIDVENLFGEKKGK